MCITLFTQPLSEESNLSVCEECRFLPLEKAKVVYLLVILVFWQINLTRIKLLCTYLLLYLITYYYR